MIINEHTTISKVLNANPDALDAIISLSTRFRKLRNPVLRKLMAPRTSIETAAKMGGCSVEDFFSKLQPLGFVAERISFQLKQEKQLPSFLANIDTDDIEDLDVRDLIASGKDPLQLILKTTSRLKEGKVLRIINTFEPVPLMKLLENKGFSSFADVVADELVETYFYKVPGGKDKTEVDEEAINDSDWDTILDQYRGKIRYINVQQLEMPQPMIRIMEALDELPSDHALFVYHKRIPVFLLPELKKRSLDFRIKEVNSQEVHLLIFGNSHGNSGK